MLKPRQAQKLERRDADPEERREDARASLAYEDPLLPSDLDLAPEGVFGLLDEMLDDLTAQRRANAKSEAPNQNQEKVQDRKNQDSIPEIPVSLSDLPPEFDRVQYGNVVNVSASDLQDTSKAITRNTAVLSEKMLRKLLPLLLSYASATNYTQAVLKEGLKLDIAFDPGLEEAVKHVGYLAVAHHFVRNSGLPKSTKRAYLDKLAEQMGSKTVERIFAANLAASKVSELNRLAAVVRKSQQGRAEAQQQQTSEHTPIAGSKRRSR